MLSTTPCLATLQRVFLSPVVPGWVDDSGMVRLPLRLNTVEESIGIEHTDQEALRAWHRNHSPHFASTFPELGLFRTEEEFRREYRPHWLQEAADHIGSTVAGFATRSSKDFPIARLARSLEARSASVTQLISSCLYVGSAFPDVYCIMPQDLTVFGEPLDPQRDLHGLAMLLQAALHVDTLIASGMTDIVTVVHGASRRTLHDAVGGVALNPELRPVCTYRSDEDGHIHPLQSAQAKVHDDFDHFQTSVVREINALVGTFLFAFLGWNKSHWDCLSAPRSSAVIRTLLGDRLGLADMAIYDLSLFLEAAVGASKLRSAD